MTISTTMFMGTKEYSVDEKGRVFMPPKFRDDLGETLVIYKNLETNCIKVYPYDAFETMAKDLKDLPIHNKKVSMIVDRIIGRAEPVQLDKQGRIMLPVKLRDSVKIDKEVCVVGKIDHFEVWSKEERARYEESEFDYEEALDYTQDMMWKLKLERLNGK